MPMFYTPKPRQFHYEPRFYDPEKEEWEKLKKKYAMKKAAESQSEGDTATTASADLEYFERKVRELDRKERRQSAGFSIKDLFRKREMPKFNYQSRFQDSGAASQLEQSAENSGTTSGISAEGEAIMQRMRKRKMSRRFDMEDADYFKPVSGGKIMLYVIVVFLLLLWILL